MSDYHSRHSGSPHYESSTYKTDRSYPRTSAQNLNNDDLNYKDLRKEYSKVVNYVDSVRQGRTYQANTYDIPTETNRCLSAIVPSVDNKYSSSPIGSLSKSSTVRYLDSEKRIIELEQEVNEFKKLLEANYSRVSAMQRENHTLHERLKEFKQIEQCNKQLGNEVKSLDHEILTLNRKMKELEIENAKLSAEKNILCNIRPSVPRDYQKDLTKYGNYIGHLLSGLSKDHFSQFCFEERFTNEQEFLQLIEQRDSDTLLIQAFRYIGDLLLNISSASKSNPTSAVVSPKKPNNASELNETYSSTPGKRAAAHYNNQHDDLRGLQASYTQSLEIGSPKKVHKEDSSKNLPDNSRSKTSPARDDSRRISSAYQDRLRNELMELHRERAQQRNNEKADALRENNSQPHLRRNNSGSTERKNSHVSIANDRSINADEILYRSNLENASNVSRSDARGDEKRRSQYEPRAETSEYSRRDNRQSGVRERPEPQLDDRLYRSNIESQSNSRLNDSRVSERRANRREDDYDNDLNRSNVSTGKSRSNQVEDRYVNEHQVNRDVKRSSSYKQDEHEVKNRKQPPPVVVEYEDIIAPKRSHNLQVEPHAKRSATEVVESHYYEDIPTFSGLSHRKSDMLVLEENSPKSGVKISTKQKSPIQAPRNQSYEVSSDDQYQGQKSAQALKNSNASARTKQSETLTPKARPVESNSTSLSATKQASKRSSQLSATNQNKPLQAVSSPKGVHVAMSNQNKDNGSKQARRPPNIKDPIEEFTPVNWGSDDTNIQNQSQSRLPVTPAYSQGYNEELNNSRTNYTEPNVASRNASNKQSSLTPKAGSERNLKSNMRENSTSKSPTPSSKSRTAISILDPKIKETRIPSPIGRQRTPTPQNSGKVLNNSQSQVSQIVYKSQKSLQNATSPTTSNASLRNDNVPTFNESRALEREAPQRSSQVVNRESELLQKIRELREKENELLEREREIEFQIQNAQNSAKDQSSRRNRESSLLLSSKENSSSVRSPKGDRRMNTSPPRDKPNDSRMVRRANTNEIVTDYLEEIDEPVQQRNLVKQSTLSPRDGADSDRQTGLRPILKNNESRHDTGQYSNTGNTRNEQSGYRRERSETNLDYDDYEHHSRDQRSPHTQYSDDEQRREHHTQSKDRLTPVEGSHQKRLTFGSDTNFEHDLSNMPYENEFSEPRGTPTKESKFSPQKTERSTNYASFRVSFGRTESTFKRNVSPQAKINNILNVTKKKRIDHTVQTYDVIKGQDSEIVERGGVAIYSNQDTSPIAASDNLDTQKTTNENEIAAGSDGRKAL